jgi:hypothetical protein
MSNNTSENTIEATGRNQRAYVSSSIGLEARVNEHQAELLRMRLKLDRVGRDVDAQIGRTAELQALVTSLLDVSSQTNAEVMQQSALIKQHLLQQRKQWYETSVSLAKYVAVLILFGAIAFGVIEYKAGELLNSPVLKSLLEVPAP